MKNGFNHQVTGVSPEQTRLGLTGQAPGQSMIEEEQPIPTLKPSLGMGQEVDNQMHKKRLADEHRRLQKYQMRVTEIHTTYRLNGRVVSTKMDRQVHPVQEVRREVTHDFNQHSSQSQDMRQLGLSY